MSLLKYSFTTIDGDNPATVPVETSYVVETFTKVREIQTIEEIEGSFLKISLKLIKYGTKGRENIILPPIAVQF